MAKASQMRKRKSTLPPALAQRMDGLKSQQALNRLLKAVMPHANRYHLAQKMRPMIARLNEEEFKIAVVANMSSGKSSFINALFGDQILPAFHEATTGCLTYIFPHTVKNQGRARVHFGNKREMVEIPGKHVKQEIKLYAQQDTADKPEKYRHVDRIDLYWEFETFKSMGRVHFRYVIIDTPGPNNTGHFSQKHKAITNRLIREDADLILFLFDYGQLDANLMSDQQGLWEIIKKRSQSDPFFDVLFIINKTDLALEDDARRNKPQGDSLRSAIAKLRSTAIGHGFESPDVYGVAAHYACLHKMNQKGLLHLNSLESNNNHKAYRKALIDFDDAVDPEAALADYQGIEAVEKRVFEYIRTTVESKVVSRVKWELEGVIKEVVNSAQRRISFLGQTAEKAEEGLRQGLDLLTQEIPYMRERLTGEFNTRRYDCLADAEKVIEKCAREYLLDPLENLSKEACYAIHAHFVQDVPWSEAQAAARQAVESGAASRKEFYHFTTADPTVTAATLFGMIEAYISNQLDRARQDSLNSYKLRMESILKDFVDELNEAVSQMQNELNKELAEALGTAHDSGRIQQLGDINIPPMNISIPLSCIETTEKERLVSVPDGYRREKVKKQRIVERAWYNPLRWVGKGAYLDEYEETEDKAVYKTRLEKEYKMTINPGALREKLEQRIRQGVEAWKENDTLQIYISLDQLVEQYISFFNSMEKEKRDEIYRLKADLANQESRKKAEIKNFKAFQRDLTAALPAK